MSEDGPPIDENNDQPIPQETEDTVDIEDIASKAAVPVEQVAEPQPPSLNEPLSPKTSTEPTSDPPYNGNRPREDPVDAGNHVNPPFPPAGFTYFGGPTAPLKPISNGPFPVQQEVQDGFAKAQPTMNAGMRQGQEGSEPAPATTSTDEDSKPDEASEPEPKASLPNGSHTGSEATAEPTEQAVPSTEAAESSTQAVPAPSVSEKLAPTPSTPNTSTFTTGTSASSSVTAASNGFPPPNSMAAALIDPITVQQPLPAHTTPHEPVTDNPTTTTTAPQTPSNPAASLYPRPLPQPPRPAAMDQRRQFVLSFKAYFRHNNLTPPKDLFENGEREGALKIADVWVDLVDLFMHVVRNGGIATVARMSADTPVWQTFLQSKNLPKALPEPVEVPIPPQIQRETTNTTDNTVHYLVGIYLSYLVGFEAHMTKQRNAMAQRQSQSAQGGQSPATPVQATPTPAAPVQPTPPNVSQQPVPVTTFNANATGAGFQLSERMPKSNGESSSASAPVASGSQPRPSSSGSQLVPVAIQPGQIGLPGTPNPPLPFVSVKQDDASTPGVATPSVNGFDASRMGKKRKEDGSVSTPVPVSSFVGPINGLDASATKKRKKDKKDKKGMDTSVPSTPTSVQPTATPLPPERPKTPKRTRYKVEYRPLNFPMKMLAGWDERTVASTFPKHNLSHPVRSMHDLAVIDMEAILMGLRSRLPRELGYALTVLSVMTMPHPEENISGLPLGHLGEIYLELLELLEVAVFGEEGYDAWLKAQAGDQSNDLETVDVPHLSFDEQERLGRDVDYGFQDYDDLDPSTSSSLRGRDSTGGSTDMALCILNILRNLSMLKENLPIMPSEPLFLINLSRILDVRLARTPGDAHSSRPYSLLELNRIRRDVVVILANIGLSANLRTIPFTSTLALFRLIASYLTAGFQVLVARESLYGPPVTSIQEKLPPSVQSVNVALEAFCCIAWSDHNREALSRIPSAELVDLFSGMVKLFPLTRRSDEAMHFNEDFLGNAERLSLALYSLSFLSPLSTRRAMRAVPGAVSILKRIIFDSIARRPADFSSNPFAVLTRRLCEVLGVLNGTSTPNGEVSVDMGFSAGAGGGKGWKWASGVIDKGWLAEDESRMVEGLSVRGMDAHAFGELDGMWWGD